MDRTVVESGPRHANTGVDNQTDQIVKFYKIHKILQNLKKKLTEVNIFSLHNSSTQLSYGTVYHTVQC